MGQTLSEPAIDEGNVEFRQLVACFHRLKATSGDGDCSKASRDQVQQLINELHRVRSRGAGDEVGCAENPT
jgi:hypothetical protein